MSEECPKPVPVLVQIEDDVSAWLAVESKWPQTRKLAMLKALRIEFPYHSTALRDLEASIRATLRKEIG